MFTSYENIIAQGNTLTCLWVDTISLTSNLHVILQKYVRYLVNKYTHDISLVLGSFLLRKLRFITLTNWNNPPYLWHNFILSYPMKVIRMLAQMQQIFVFFYNFFLQNKWYLQYRQPCGNTKIVLQSSIVAKSAIYLLSCLSLAFSIIIDKSLGAPIHGKYVADVLNYREKWMLKLSIEKVLNTEWIQDDQISFKSYRFMNMKNIKL